MGVMDRVCAVCLQAIRDEDQRFRVREEYVHVSCYERYLRMVSERRGHVKVAPAKHETDGDD